jgi:hypothetical protein
MNVKTSEEARNERVIRDLYALAEGNSKNTSKFVSFFTDDGYFYDVGAGKKYFGAEIGATVDVYAAAFPDMHRELYAVHSFGDHVLVELSLNGTHKRPRDPAGYDLSHRKSDTCALLRRIPPEGW